MRSKLTDLQRWASFELLTAAGMRRTAKATLPKVLSKNNDVLLFCTLQLRGELSEMLSLFPSMISRIA